MGGRAVDKTFRSEAIEWGPPDVRLSDATPIATGQIIISGPCVQCRKDTEFAVRGDADTVIFLCPPCGKAIREGRPV